jgi:hypothetical protein
VTSLRISAPIPRSWLSTHCRRSTPPQVLHQIRSERMRRFTCPYLRTAQLRSPWRSDAERLHPVGDAVRPGTLTRQALNSRSASRASSQAAYSKGLRISWRMEPVTTGRSAYDVSRNRLCRCVASIDLAVRGQTSTVSAKAHSLLEQLTDTFREDDWLARALRGPSVIDRNSQKTVRDVGGIRR